MVDTNNLRKETKRLTKIANDELIKAKKFSTEAQKVFDEMTKFQSEFDRLYESYINQKGESKSKHDHMFTLFQNAINNKIDFVRNNTFYLENEKRVAIEVLKELRSWLNMMFQ